MSRIPVLVGLAAGLIHITGPVAAQGQDSTTAERDGQVIAALLPGIYSNANQSYFDVRTNSADPQRRLRVEISAVDAQPGQFLVRSYLDSDSDSENLAWSYTWELPGDAAGKTIRLVSKEAHPRRAANPATCELEWTRSAAEFVAVAKPACDAGQPARIVLSDKQLWIEVAGTDGGLFKLHRARPFECYADIPGVGGGRDEPYERYAGLDVHDQGGSAWFTSTEGRRLGISMLLVDWPINNYDGAFARDSLVVYVSEDTEAGRQELGYAFTVPEANRIGINLKWMLVNCFMQSNDAIQPFM